ncbi:hypothetical protein DYB37_000729 [Aphanomyces astaci]|uniref:THH1/TOM1/TOM3 domain-containing protein n=3 Tax=Aphanomyces astaci TaxID=112090 RepID=A0A418F1F9_APHAT|nr:hypothetical protein DYB35_002777 [Aphanomyces astaci]RHZ22375.1 hypothetical protein DYB37_000729 [Aphanomyces astaci]
MPTCVLEDNITCCFGLYKNNTHCSVGNTVASLSRVKNDALRIGLLVFGVVAFIACLCKLYSIRRNGGSTIQRRAYMLMAVASFTFVARAPDPRSHERIYHPIVSGLFVDICSAAIYGVIILYAAFYARLVAPPARTAESEHYIRGFSILAFFMTGFIFLIVRPAYLARRDRNIFDSWHVLVQFSMAPVVLFITSSTALHFGLQAYRRLSAIRETDQRADDIDAIRQLTRRQLHDLRGSTTPAATTAPPAKRLSSATSVPAPPPSTSSQHGSQAVPSPTTHGVTCPQPSMMQTSSHEEAQAAVGPVMMTHLPPIETSSQDNQRVLKVLVLMELCAVVNIALQGIAVCVVYWSFRKTRRGGDVQRDLGTHDDAPVETESSLDARPRWVDI